MKCLLTVFPIRISNECYFLLLDIKVCSKSYRNEISLKENMHSIHNNLTDMCWLSHFTQLCNMCLLDRIYSTFSSSKIRKSLLQILISILPLYIYLSSLCFTSLGNDSNLFSSCFCFLVLNLKLFDKLVYLFLCFLQFYFFFL